MRDDFLRYQAQTSPHPLLLDIERAEGLYLYGRDGRRYADMISGLAVCNVGHRHPHVVAAVERQVGRYLHVMPYGEFVQGPQVALSRKLASLMPAGLEATYFVNSGAEAIEGALKLAKRYTGRRRLVAAEKSYHGSTHGALSVSGNATKRDAFEPLLPGVRFVPYGDVGALEAITSETAAVLLETVQGDAGVRIPPLGYLTAVRARCDETGALMILDEIQTGMGRTGTMFAFEQFGAAPDVVCLAKALGAGMPMGAFVARPEVMRALSFEPMLGHITTFGGHPVSCAAALAGIEVVEEEGLLADIERKGQLLAEGLRHPLVQDIRQIGLMLAVDLPSAEVTYEVVAECIERGVLTFYFLSCPASFRLAPPLMITEKEIEEVCAVIREVMDGVGR